MSDFAKFFFSERSVYCLSAALHSPHTVNIGYSVQHPPAMKPVPHALACFAAICVWVAHPSTLQAAGLQASDGAVFDSFGGSESVSGSIGLVGAYTDDIGSNADQGSAYVFRNLDTASGASAQNVKLTASRHRLPARQFRSRTGEWLHDAIQRHPGTNSSIAWRSRIACPASSQTQLTSSTQDSRLPHSLQSTTTRAPRMRSPMIPPIASKRTPIFI